MKNLKFIPPEVLEFNPQNAVTRVLTDIRQIASRERVAYIGLAGGNSLDLFYGELAKQWDVDLSCVEFFLVDERISPLPEERNLEHLESVFFGSLRARMKTKPKIHIPQSPGPFPFPRSDLLILSSGEDGHIASLFPGHAALESAERNYSAVENSPKPPARRLTVSPQVILESHCIHLFFLGASKTRALKDFLDPMQSVSACPAKIALLREHDSRSSRTFYH